MSHLNFTIERFAPAYSWEPEDPKTKKPRNRPPKAKQHTPSLPRIEVLERINEKYGDFEWREKQ